MSGKSEEGIIMMSNGSGVKEWGKGTQASADSLNLMAQGSDDATCFWWEALGQIFVADKAVKTFFKEGTVSEVAVLNRMAAEGKAGVTYSWEEAPLPVTPEMAKIIQAAFA